MANGEQYWENSLEGCSVERRLANRRCEHQRYQEMSGRLVREIEGRRQPEDELKDCTSRLRLPTPLLLESPGPERRRLAKELHQEPGQALLSLTIPKDLEEEGDDLTLSNCLG